MKPAERASTTKGLSRSWLRGGLLRDLSWAECFVLLQVAWNEPVRAHRIFGLEERYRRRCLSRLLEKGYVIKTDDGYSLHAEAYATEEKDRTWVWFWPLRWHIGLREKVVFILLDEQTRGRRWINRTHLAKQLGINRDTLYEALDGLYDEGLAWPVGKAGKIVCFNHAEDLKAETMERLLAHPDYIREQDDEDNEKAILAAFRERAARRHGQGRAPTPAGSGTDTARVARRHTDSPPVLSGLSKGSLPATQGAGEGAGTSWPEAGAKALAPVASRRLRESGAKQVPASPVLQRGIAAVLAEHQDLPQEEVPLFLSLVQDSIARSSYFMWKELHLALPGLLSSVRKERLPAARRSRAAHERAEEAKRAEKARLREEQSGLLVAALREKSLYSIEALLAKDIHGTPRIVSITQKNPLIGSSVLALDPVTAEAWKRCAASG